MSGPAGTRAQGAGAFREHDRGASMSGDPARGRDGGARSAPDTISAPTGSRRGL
jgi:hypothetical protein